MSNLKLVRETAFAVVFRATGAIAGLILSLAIARLMTVEQAGLCFLGLTVVTVLFNVGALGMHGTMLRFVSGFVSSNDWRAINGLIRVAVIRAGIALLLLSLGLAAAARFLAVTVFNKPLLEPVLVGLAPAVLFLGLGLLVAHQLQAALRIKKAIFVLSIGSPFFAGGVIVILGIDRAAEFAWVYAAAALLTLGFGLRWWYGERPSSTVSAFDLHDLWRSCTPLWIASIMSMSILWGAQLVAGIYVDTAEIALLAVSQRLALLVSFILISVNIVVSPRFAALHKQGDLQGIRRLAIRTVRLMALIAAPMLIVCWLFPGSALRIFGNEFGRAEDLLRILATAQFVNVMSGPVAYLLMMTGNESDQRNAVTVGAAVAIVASFVLIPPFGITGAAIAAAMPLVAQNFVSVLMVKKRLGFTTVAFWRTE